MYTIKVRFGNDDNWSSVTLDSYNEFKEKMIHIWKSLSHASNPKIQIESPRGIIDVDLEEGTPIDIKRVLKTV